MLVQTGVALALALLALLLPFAYGPGAMAQLGAATMHGGREAMPEIRGWPGRARRAHANLVENLVPFAIVAATLQATGTTSPLSGAAALAFLALRLTHAAAYVANLGRLRTAAYLGGVLATLATAAPLLALPVR